MKKYRVLVRGENFIMRSEESMKRFGFYTTRFIEARHKEEAEQHAIKALQQDERLQNGVLNDRSDPPRLVTEEVGEISSFDGIENLTPGLVFFEDEANTN